MNLNISLIRASFEEIKPIATEVVAFFYRTLFETYPMSRALFEKTNLEKQKQALISSLVKIVDHLDDPESLVPYLKKMGGRHVQYGAQEEHYSMVGKSLITTFRHYFGENWTRELEDQWILAIGIIAEHMLDGAKDSATTQQKVYEIGGVSAKPEQQDLSQMVRQLARNLLFKSLEQEADGEFMKLARKKAANILTQALREEADLIHEQFNAKKKAS